MADCGPYWNLYSNYIFSQALNIGGLCPPPYASALLVFLSVHPPLGSDRRTSMLTKAGFFNEHIWPKSRRVNRHDAFGVSKKKGVESFVVGTCRKLGDGCHAMEKMASYRGVWRHKWMARCVRLIARVVCNEMYKPNGTNAVWQAIGIDTWVSLLICADPGKKKVYH